MIELNYYCLSDIKEDEVEIEIFKSISTQQFKDNYYFLKEKTADINLFFYDEDIQPFIDNDLVRKTLEKEGLTKLPIVILNGKLIKKGQFLSTKEIGNILDIGISTQESDDNY